jgi:predicted AAA+ superfamily ATPase
MQHKGQAIEHALSLINILKQDLKVLQQLVEEVRDTEEEE